MGHLRLTQVYKNFGKAQVLNGIDLELTPGSQQVLVGASGSGKSTLLHLIGGLDKPNRGEIFFDSKSLGSLSDEELAFYRNRKIGFVFQFHFLLSSMTALENIYLPAKIGNLMTQTLISEVAHLSERLGVAHCLNKYPHQLSGGEQQRINLIRAISLKPEILLCDEPTGNLDTINSQKVVELLKELSLELQNTLLLVTHDQKIASQFERKITIEDGRIIG